MKRLGFSEEKLNHVIDDYEGDSDIHMNERAVLRFVDRFATDPTGVGEEAYEELQRHLDDDEIVQVLIYLVLNLGMHIFFATLDFYPMFSPDGRLVSQEESRRIYGEKPSPIETSSDQSR